MGTNEGNSDIHWTKSKEWGATGLTHRLLVVIGEDNWSFTVDQPAKGQWVARGWRNNHMSFYFDDKSCRTLAGVKEQVEWKIGELKIQAAKLAAQEAELRDEAVDRLAVGLDLPIELVESEPECWCEWVDIGVGMQRVTDNPECEQHNPDPLMDLAEDWCTLCGHVDCLPTCPAYVRPVVDRPLPEVDMTEAARHLNAWVGVVNGGMVELGRRVATAVDEMTRLFRKSFHHPPCGCPTPTHRMSCGVGATPKVVTK